MIKASILGDVRHEDGTAPLETSSTGLTGQGAQG